MVLGIAWGTIISAISNQLMPKNNINSAIVQLNGAGNTRSIGNSLASDTVKSLCRYYIASSVQFPGVLEPPYQRSCKEEGLPAPHVLRCLSKDPVTFLARYL